MNTHTVNAALVWNSSSGSASETLSPNFLNYCLVSLVEGPVD